METEDRTDREVEDNEGDYYDVINHVDRLGS